MDAQRNLTIDLMFEKTGTWGISVKISYFKTVTGKSILFHLVWIQIIESR